MKLTKLLPIATIGCVASIVTPLATSCGGASSEFLIDGSSIYIPTIERAKYTQDEKTAGGVADEAAGLKKYLSAVKDNPEIYGQDLACGLSYMAYWAVRTDTTIVGSPIIRIKCDVSNVSADPEKSLLSYTLKGSIEYVANITAESTPVLPIISMDIASFEVNAVNNPMEAVYSAGNVASSWNFKSKYEEPWTTNNSSLTIKVDKGRTIGAAPTLVVNYDNWSVTYNKDNPIPSQAMDAESIREYCALIVYLCLFEGIGYGALGSYYMSEIDVVQPDIQ